MNDLTQEERDALTKRALELIYPPTSFAAWTPFIVQEPESPTNKEAIPLPL